MVKKTKKQKEVAESIGAYQARGDADPMSGCAYQIVAILIVFFGLILPLLFVICRYN